MYIHHKTIFCSHVRKALLHKNETKIVAHISIFTYLIKQKENKTIQFARANANNTVLCKTQLSHGFNLHPVEFIAMEKIR